MEFMTAKELGQMFRCSAATVTRLARDRKIKSVRVRGRLLFRRAAVEAFVAAQEEARSQPE